MVKMRQMDTDWINGIINTDWGGGLLIQQNNDTENLHQSKNDNTENLHQSLTYTSPFHHKLYQLDEEHFNIKFGG